MKTLTSVGEIVIHADRDVLLRPSLSAMASLGDPTEIVEIFARVMSSSFTDCLGVLYACADQDVSGLFGFHNEKLNYVPGEIPQEHIVLLAQCLMKHGIVGVCDTPKNTEKGYLKEFDAKKFASLAVAHLGMNESDAWNMTMTGLVSALQAKYPPEKEAGSDAPTKEEYNETMAWFERVEANRKLKQGAH